MSGADTLGIEGMRRSITLLTIFVVVAGGMILGDVTGASDTDATDATDPVPVSVSAGDAAVTYCPVATGDADDVTVSVAAVGEEPSEVVVVAHDGDGATTVAEPTIEPGQREVVDLADGGPVTVRSRGGAVAAVWNVTGERSTAGTCVPEPAPVSYIVGMDTTLGSQSSLHLFNPFTVDAVVRVRYGTADGAAELVSTDNVAVAAGTVETLDLTAVQPEEPGLAVVVETLTGRVVAQGEIERSPIDDDDDGPTGRTLVPAIDAMSSSAVFAHGTSGDWRSTVAVYNPSDRQAAVRIHTTDPNPDTPVEEVLVPAGGVTNVSLTNRSTSEVFAVRVDSLTDLPIAATLLEQRPGESAGISAMAGAAEGATAWATAGTTSARVEALSVYNPGDAQVEVTATLAGEPVRRWQSRTIEAGERQVLRLADLDAPGWPARIEASDPVVVSVASVVEEGPDAARLGGLMLPLPLRDPPGTVPHARHDGSLSVTPVDPVEITAPGDR